MVLMIYICVNIILSILVTDDFDAINTIHKDYLHINTLLCYIWYEYSNAINL